MNMTRQTQGWRIPDPQGVQGVQTRGLGHPRHRERALVHPAPAPPQLGEHPGKLRLPLAGGAGGAQGGAPLPLIISFPHTHLNPLPHLLTFFHNLFLTSTLPIALFNPFPLLLNLHWFPWHLGPLLHLPLQPHEELLGRQSLLASTLPIALFNPFSSPRLFPSHSS